MTNDFSHRGAFNINGQWATSVRYAATREHGIVTEVHLRFLNGDSEIASAQLEADDVRTLLGDTNYAAIVGTGTSARPIDAGSGHAVVAGELLGQSLEFRQVTLTPTENTISLDSRVPDRTDREGPPSGRAAHRDTLEGSDYVVGAAHATQLSGAAGPVLQGAAQAVGVADAARLATDAARGKNVRATDAAAAVSSVTLTSGVGGPALQTAASLGAAAGAADTARRAVNTADDTAEKLSDGNAPASDRDESARRRLAQATAIPDAVAQRFLRVEDRYYFPDRTLAFTDRGTKLKAETHNLEVIRSLVAIAEARDWQAITVTGTEEFRSEVWREASLRGIEVHGYRASDVEIAALQRAAERSRGTNPPSDKATRDAQESPSREPTQAQQPTTASATTRDDRRVEAGAQTERFTGRLINTGAAPYRFNPTEGLSYYVKLETDRGERILWGVDLERALVESQSAVKVGDLVTVENRGAVPVTVKAHRRNAAGEVIGVDEIATHRNAWLIETVSFLDQRAKKAAALRDATAPRRELLREHPDLAGAVINLWLSEKFAAQRIERPDDRERVVSLVREQLAQAIERGEAISAPQLKRHVARYLEAAGGTDDAIPLRTRARTAREASPNREHPAEDPPHVRA